MSAESRKRLDEAMKDNPLWQYHRRMMDPLICPELLEPEFDEARRLIIDSLEGRTATDASPSIQLEVPDNDAKQ